MEQGTPEWFAVRKNKMTASNAQEIGNAGAGLETCILGIMVELFSSATKKEHYTNNHIDRGKELEEHARALYELEHGVTVEQVGFIEYDEYSGCSPDGLVGEDELIEIKCHEDMKHLKLLLNGEKEINTSYIWQMQMQMLVTNRKKCTYIAYNPNFQRSMVCFTVLRDEEKIEKLREGLRKGTELIVSITERMKKLS